MDLEVAEARAQLAASPDITVRDSQRGPRVEAFRVVRKANPTMCMPSSSLDMGANPLRAEPLPSRTNSIFAACIRRPNA
jgi:hypothetical protein